MAALHVNVSSGCSVLITGASGLLGRALMNTFKKSGKWADNAVLGTAFSRYKTENLAFLFSINQTINL